MAQAGQNAALKETPSEGIDKKHACQGVTRILDAKAGRIELLMPDGTTPRKKIALCGFASTSRTMAPFDDPDYAIVGMNQLNRHIPRADVWFEIHRRWNDAVVPGTDHEGFLRDCGMPVFMSDDEGERIFPSTWVRFPIERVIAKFNDYVTSTVAAQLAWAIDYIDDKVEAQLKDLRATGQDATVLDAIALAKSLYREWEIAIFGVDLVVGEEYVWQRPCAEYYLGQALARDIMVRIPKPSALLKQRYRYGYDMEPQDLIKDSDIEKHRVQIVNEWQATHDKLMQLTGAEQELKYWTEVRTLRERGADV